MSGLNSAQQQQLLKILEDLLKLPENRDCADCGTKAPRWASTNLGVFVCIRCSGIHRSMGVHISKVKSVSLDKWLPEQVEVMQKMGNGRAKEIYEANVNGHHKGDIKNDNIALEQWIRDKYEHKRFMKRDYDSRPVHHAPAHHNAHHNAPSHHNTHAPASSHHTNAPAPLAPPTSSSRPRAPSGGAPSSRPRGPSGGSASLPTPSFNPSFSVAPQPKPTPAPVPAPAAKSSIADDLLNWDAPAPTPTTLQSNDSDFGDFVAATPAQPAVDKDSIMSLFRPPMAPAPVMHAGYPYGAPPPGHYPAPNYNVHGLGVPGVPNIMMNMPATGIPGGMPSGMPPGAAPQGGMPPHMMGYPPQPYGAPGYPPVGGVPQYYGIPGQQMGMHSNIPSTF